MNAEPSHVLAAELLERGAAGYAGLAAAAMIARDPALRARFGAETLTGWKQHLTQRLIELSAAVSSAEPQLFVARVLWTVKAFKARKEDESGIRLSLEALRDVLAERLPAPARAVPLQYVDEALQALGGAAPGPDRSELDPARPADALALRYLHKVLEGDVPGAVAEVVNAARDGRDMRSAYLDVLLPAQREIGRLWHLGEVTVAEEHLVTSTTQRTMAVLAHAARPAPPNGKSAIVAAVASNAHDVGLRAIADLYQLAGWRAIFLGADVPIEDLPAVVDFFQADLVLLGATIATQLPRVRQTIAGIRARSGRPVQVIVGGAAFDETAGLWEKVGADGYASRVDEAVTLGARLAGV